MRWSRVVRYAAVGFAVGLVTAVFVANMGVSGATTKPLQRLPRLPQPVAVVQTPVGAVFAAMKSDMLLPPEKLGHSLEKALRQYPVSDAAWTRSARALFRGCLARATVPTRVLREECRLGGCLFLVATENTEEQSRVLQTFANDTSCAGGEYGRLNTNPWSEGAVAKTLHVYLSPS
jgi:hypothetical protein